MPRATCRCGQKLSFPADGPERVICPKCSAKIRVKRRGAEAEAEAAGEPEGDGYLRFPCPCGRRLKVRDTEPRPQAGKCPDCGRIVPVPTSGAASAPSPARGGAGGGGGIGAGVESPTEVMSPEEIATIERWADGHRLKPRGQDYGQGQVVVGQPLPSFEPLPLTELAIPGDGKAYPGAGPSSGSPQAAGGNSSQAVAAPAPVKVEVGLRVCPRCGRPVHLGAETCRQCGAPVPRR